MGFEPTSAVGLWRERLVTLVTQDTPERETAVALLTAWDLQTDPDNTRASLMMMTLSYLHDAGVVSASQLGLDTVSDEQLLTAFEQAMSHLQTHFGRLDVPWGQVNRLQRGSVDLPLGGGPDTLHAIYGVVDETADDGRLHGIAGDSYILLVTWDAHGNVSSHSIHQFGTGNPRCRFPPLR